MTATRVITEHDELGGIGELTHEQLEQFVATTQFVIVSGTVGFSSGSRKIVASNGIIVTDNGPGQNLTFSLDEDYVTSLANGINFVDNETPSGVVDGINLTFSLQFSPNPTASLHLFLNGLLQEGEGYNYILSGNVVSFSNDNVPMQNDRLKATYRY